MKIISITRHCDGCGVGPNESGNVPYLGWVDIEVFPDGIPMAEPMKADLCGTCAKRVWANIPLREA